jgi:hypothetical protein
MVAGTSFVLFFHHPGMRSQRNGTSSRPPTAANAGIRFATLTHAARLSSTGDPVLDRRLPFDEPYRIPATTAAMIADVKSNGARIVAVDTTRWCARSTRPRTVMAS